MRKLSLPLTLLACWCTAAAASATELRVNVTKQPIMTEDGQRVQYVTFADAPFTAMLSLTIADLPIRQLPSPEQQRLAALPQDEWWREITWTLRDRATNATRAFGASDLRIHGSMRSERGPHAGSPVARNGSVDFIVFEAQVTFPKVPPGDYALTAKLGSLTDSDTFAVRLGTESPRIRSAYLQRDSLAAKTYDDYKHIQLQRLDATPTDATILTELAGRASIDGTQLEATNYYQRAIAVIMENIRQYAAAHPEAAAKVTAGGQAQVRYLQEALRLLPEFFRHRDTLQLDHVQVGGEWHYVLRDRVSHQVVKVAE